MNIRTSSIPPAIWPASVNINYEHLRVQYLNLDLSTFREFQDASNLMVQYLFDIVFSMFSLTFIYKPLPAKYNDLAVKFAKQFCMMLRVLITGVRNSKSRIEMVSTAFQTLEQCSQSETYNKDWIKCVKICCDMNLLSAILKNYPVFANTITSMTGGNPVSVIDIRGLVKLSEEHRKLINATTKKTEIILIVIHCPFYNHQLNELTVLLNVLKYDQKVCIFASREYVNDCYLISDVCHFDCPQIEPYVCSGGAVLCSAKFTPQCQLCVQPGRLKCSKCRFVRYCSQTCQREDWKLHREHCEEINLYREELVQDFKV